MKEQLALLPEYLTAHLQLALVALLMGATISIPLGVWASSRPRLQVLVLTLSSMIQTIPSLALLAIMVPVLAALSHGTQHLLGFAVSSIGYLPALIALLLYSMLPILRNTVTGIAGVDAALVEAARGVGMTDKQRLWRVELPLALPMIVAGMRTATVWVVGMTVLSTPVGAPSLGNYIFTGLQTRNFHAVIVGCIASACLALFLDWCIRSIEVGLLGNQRGRFVAALACVAGLYLYVGGTALWSMHLMGPPRQELRVGGKTFTEQYILSEILAEQLRQRTGLPVRIVASLGSTVVFDALKNGSIDAYVEYTGTAWTTLMKRQIGEIPRDQVRDAVEAYMRKEQHIGTAAVLGFENTYALAMRRADAEARHIQSIEDLAVVAPQLSIAGDYEFFGRSEWTGLRSTYNLAFKQVRSMDPAIMYTAIEDSAVDVVTAYTTDGRLHTLDLKLLDEPHGMIPPYDAIVLAGPDVQKNPQAMAALQALNGKLDVKTMRRLNALVDSHTQTATQVAREFVRGLNAPQP